MLVSGKYLPLDHISACSQFSKINLQLLVAFRKTEVVLINSVSVLVRDDAGHSAREGARELATDNSDLPKKNPPYVKTAVEDLPKAWRKGAKVDKADSVTVRVKLNVPIVVPQMKSPWRVSSEAGTSVEDEPLPPSQSKAGL